MQIVEESVASSIQMKYTYFSHAFFVTFRVSLALMTVYYNTNICIFDNYKFSFRKTVQMLHSVTYY